MNTLPSVRVARFARSLVLWLTIAFVCSTATPTNACSLSMPMKHYWILSLGDYRAGLIEWDYTAMDAGFFQRTNVILVAGPFSQSIPYVGAYQFLAILGSTVAGLTFAIGHFAAQARRPIA